MIDSWPYDLMVSGELSFENEITDAPLEQGSDVNDAIIKKPIEFNLEAIVSDSPLEPIASHPSRKIDEVSEAVFGSDQIPLPSAEAYDRLLAIRDDKKLVTIEIPFATRDGKPGKRTFVNMGITRLSIPLTADTTGGLTFSASWKQVNMFQNRKVTVRTATPSGKGKDTGKATVGHPYQVDQRVLWRQGRPAGAALNPNYDWAVVNVSWSDGRGGPSAKAQYHYSSEHSPGVNHTANDVLSPEDLHRYITDLARDQAEKKQDALHAPQRQRDADAAAARARQGPSKDPTGKFLPDGVDLSRFQKPDAGPTLPNTNPTNTPQGVDLNRFTTPSKPTF